MTSLVFVEYPQDVKYLLKKGIYKKDMEVFALGPEALLELERINIPYKTLDNVIEKEEYNNLIYYSAKEFESIYSFLLKNLKNLNDVEKVFGSFEGILEQVCSNIIIKSRCLKKVLLAYNPSRIYFFLPAKNSLSNDHYLHNLESYYSLIISYVVKRYSEKIEIVAINSQVKSLYLKTELINLFKKVLLTLRDLLQPRKDEYTKILILEDSREIKLFFEKTKWGHYYWFFRNRFPINPFQNRTERVFTLIKNCYKYILVRKDIAKIWKIFNAKIKENKKYEELFQCPLWERSMKPLFTKLLPITKINMDETVALFNSTEIKAIVTNSAFMSYCNIVLQTAQNVGIPRICFQHGLHARPLYASEKYGYFKNISHFFSYGHQVLKSEAPQWMSVKTVGSLFFEEMILSNIANNIKPLNKRKGIRILYPLGVWTNAIIMYNYVGACHPLNGALKILDFISKYRSNEVEIYVKTYINDCSALIDRYKNNNQIKFITKGITGDYVYDCDILLMDYLSTSVIEGLAADLKIMIWDFCHLHSLYMQEIISKRCFYTESESEIFSELKKIIERGDVSGIDKNNSEYEMGFISPSRDGNNVQRYIQAFNDISSEAQYARN